MKKGYKLFGMLLFLLVGFQNVQAQLTESIVGPTVTIVGNTSPTVGSTESYTISISGKMLISSANWSVSSGGTISGLSDFLNVSITWNSTGTQTVYYNITSSSYGAMQATLTVTPTGGGVPLSPPSPTIVSSNCTSAILAASGVPPTGDTWYWQGTNPNGTSTANPATSNYTTIATGKHYIRAYKASSGQWSTPSFINVGYTITVWYPDPDGDGFGGGLGTLTQCAQPTGYVANNDDDCPFAYGEAAYNGCPPPVELSNENYIYTIVPQVPVSSLNQIGVNSDAIKNVQYFDGLGRLKQSIGVRQSPNETDIITHAEYDSFGRQKKEYLPYASSNLNGEISLTAKTDTENYYKTAYSDDINAVMPNPFSEKEFEESPINRVTKQASPGYDWRLGGGHEIESEYDTNTGNEVRRYEVTTVLSNNVYVPTLTLNTSSNNNNGYYQVGELTKTVTKDENHTSGSDGTIEEFTDFGGQLILKRTYDNAQKHDTYYVYDDYGNLSFVLPPKSEANVDIPNSTEISELCYQYKYDGRNRLVEKKIPGKGKEFVIYDNLDRPVMTQDAIQKSSNKWLFTKYDKLGRVVYTGIYTHGSGVSQSSMQNTFNIHNNLPTELYEDKVSSGTGSQNSYYTNNDFPSANTEILTVNYYDNYVFDRAGTPLPSGISYIYADSNTQATITDRVIGTPSGSKVKVLGTSNWITTVTYYDQRARPVYVYSKNEYLNTTDVVQSELDFSGKVITTTSKHTNTSNTQATITVVDNFTYDHVSRLLTQTQQINSNPIEVIVSNAYDELGQLVSKRVGGTTTDANGLQIVDYSYNVRGWLKKINNDSNGSDNDLFNFTLSYNDPTSGTALYNGNIAQTSWFTANTDSSIKTYTYSYDALNRIISGNDNTGNYNLTSVSYDKNGNITNLQRKGHTNALATSFGVMDNLTYTYDGNSNQLKKVLDDGADNYGFKDGVNTTTEYTYDVNGNMKTDANKGITSIAYNHLNLPTTVTISGNTITYVYDATGTKQSKLVQGVTTQYAGGYVYEKNQIGNPELQFFSHAEGYVKYENGSFDYVYQYKDHLGNIRLSYADTNGDGSIDASTEIIEESNYYPFGLKHKGYNNIVSSNGNSTAQKFGFNGKELEESLDLNTLDLGARHMDPVLGRFMTIDPMADFVNYQSPYALADNNPIQYVDHYGLGIGDWLRRLFGGRRLKCGVRGKSSKRFRLRKGRTKAQRKKDREKRRKARIRRRRAKKSSTPTSPSNTESRNSVGPLTINPFGPISLGGNIDTPEITPRTPIVSLPKPPIERPDSPVPPGGRISFNKSISFEMFTDRFKDIDLNERILSNLIKTLKEYPQLKLLILGNSATVGAREDTPARLNGGLTTRANFQLARARAIEKFLISKGIDWRRITVGSGKTTDGSIIGGGNATFIIKN